MTRLSQVREALARGDYDAAAKVAYVGWNGWHHSWHWSETWVHRREKQLTEARAAAEDIRKQIIDLNDRVAACDRLVSALEDVLAFKDAVEP